VKRSSETPGLGVDFYPIQEHGLPDTSQSIQDQTSHGSTCTDPIERDHEAFD
jgi:hypothetical protein